MTRFLQHGFLLLGLLSSCGEAPQRQPPSSAAPEAAAPTKPDSVPIPYGPPAVIAQIDPNYRYSEDGRRVAFTDSIDQQIAAAALPPGPEARERCEFTRYVPDDRLDEGECCNDWTPWLTEFYALEEFLPWGGDSDTTGGRYPRPVLLPNAAGRQLFLAESSEVGSIVLLEFRDGRYRALVLGRHNVFGGVRHRLYRHPDADLLVLENTLGAMGAGRGAGGYADTHLQTYDLRRNRWLLDTHVYLYDTQLGYEDEAGENHEGGNQSIHRYYRVRDRGRTIVLGKYLLNAGEQVPANPAAFRLRRRPPRLYGRQDADSTDLPAGTYRLVAGRYRRVAR